MPLYKYILDLYITTERIFIKQKKWFMSFKNETLHCVNYKKIICKFNEIEINE